MADKILNNLLNCKIPPKIILEWLTTDNSNDVQWLDFNKNCPKEEFIVFFLNYLQDQFSGALQTINPSKQTPAKKNLDNVLKISENVVSTKANENTHADIKTDLNGPTNHTENIESSQQSSAKKSNLNSNISKNTIVTPIKDITPQTNKSTEIQNVLQTNLISSISSPQTSTPVIKKKISSNRKRAELISCNSSQDQNFNPAFKDSIEYERVNNSTGRNISFDNNSFPSLGGNNSSNLNTSNVSSKHFNKSDSSDLCHSNLSPKSNNLSLNKTLQSPVSPLYSNSLMYSPINVKVSQNRFNDSPINNSFFQQNITSTPERTSNTVPRNAKTTPRHNISLGDFIITESRSSKKSSGKKNASKVSLKSEEQNDHSQHNISTDASGNCSKQNARRRKVNPTRLNLTDEKGSEENKVFENVSRPFTQNPQFVNVPPIEKSSDNACFQVERGLVKIERQKKPETVVNTNVDSSINVSEKQSQPRWKILSRTPSKSVQTSSIIIPNKTLVENMEVLNILIELYNGFLDHNLVVNPMTEMYFVISLITVQYTNNTKQLLTPLDKASERTEKFNEELHDSNDAKKNLLSLRKSLNFDDLLEEKVVEIIKSDNDKNLQSNKTSTELGCFNLGDDTKENINQINTKLKQISINETNNEKLNNLKEEKNVEDLNVTKDCVKMYLGTPHNCVYFSTHVLNYQKAFLKCLDRVTLKLLCENSQIATFQPELCKYLDRIYNDKVAESTKIKPLLSIGTVDLNVCFQIDTDNREKFPSTIAFSCFRKQRDMFYEILKIWEDNHLVPGWTFQIALNGKIKSMLMVHVDITNFTHLARLFTSQMLISCIQTEQQDDSLDDETLSFLKDLKDINPEKLTQLRKKLVTPLSQNGPVPLPSFPGIQEFYKDFILYVSHPMFHTYLENTFIHEIMELNNSQFVGSDIEETELEVDERTKQNFVVCLSSLRLLSKFLGYMTSLPYRSETSMLEDVINSQLILRSESLPRIDLKHCLQSALIEGKLSLTVPWVVEYLAMMDHASLRLSYYKKVLEMLYCIYRACNYCSIIKSEEFMSQRTAILIKLAIGWLFELPIFPKELYYSWQSKYSDKALKLICDIPQSVSKIDCSLADAETSIVSVKHNLFLDKLEMVDDRILYSCCPFLKELNILLTPGNSNLNNSITYRHVTPVTSQLQKPFKKANTKHLEIQLEEAFFHGQPASTRKTVEYVSERVASSCVKYIYNKLLPMERQKNSEALKKIVEEKYSEVVNTDTVKKALLKDMNILSTTAPINIKEKSEQIIPKICESRVTQSIESLLAEDCLIPVKNMCIKITIRMAMERIDQWIQSHITGGSIFMKDMEMELNKILKENEDAIKDRAIIDRKLHNPSAKSPTDIINDMRELICDLLETNGKTITADSLSKFWDQLYLSLTERCDLRMTSAKMISSLSADLCIFLITLKEDLFTTDIQQKVCKVWKINHLKFSESTSPLCNILSSRNVIIMAQSIKDNIWLNCGKFLKKLLKENILSIDLLTDQAVALLKHEWPIRIMKNLSVCIREALDSYKTSDEETVRIRLLLDWVAGAYNDMDQDSFYLD